MADYCPETDVVRPMTEEDLALVLGWRNHSEVRRYMYNQNHINANEHELWFRRGAADDRKHLLIFESSGIPAGFVSLSRVGEGMVGDWGFYLAPDAAKGTGRRLGMAALSHAFKVLNFHKICGTVLAFNERSIQFHHRLSFQQEGILREHYFDGQKYHDVYCFGLIQSEWRLVK